MAGGGLAPEEVRALRLAAQLLAPRAERPVADVVRALGAVQAQDLRGSRWALGVRTGATAAAVTRLLADGTLLRTHVLRPTWHLVAREDLQPLVAASGDAVLRAVRPVLTRTGLDPANLRRVLAVLEARLASGEATRGELADLLGAAGIDMSDGVRLANGLLAAEAAGLICSGPPRDGTETYALVLHRAPPAPPVPRSAVLADLALRYFTTRGPATAADFRWWSGLSAADARDAVEAARGGLDAVDAGGRTLLLARGAEPASSSDVLLLPNYDEYLVAYTDRSELFDDRFRPLLDSRSSPIAQHVVVVDGAVAGTWSASFRSGRLEVAAALFAAPPARDRARVHDGLAAAADRFGRHRERDVALTVTVG